MAEKRDERIRIMRIIARMNVGGPAVEVTNLMQGLDSSRFDHRLFTGYCDADEADYLETTAPDLPVQRIDGLGRSISPVKDALALLELIKEIRAFRPHVIHTHTAKAGVIGRLASVLSLHRSILIHTFHGHLLHGYFSPIKTKIVILIEKSLALFTDHLIAVGASVMNDLLAVGLGKPEKFSVIFSGLQLKQLPTRETGAAILNLDPALTYCSIIGRVTKIKRPDRFLDVAQELKNRDVPVHFLIAGAGDLYEYCIERAEKDDLPTTFLGWRSDIENVLSVSDLVLLTSDNEGTPLSLIQAGMAGLPVVATNVGSISEIVTQGKAGYLVDVDAYALADAVEELVYDPALRKKMGQFAVNFTKENFSI